MQIKEGLYLVDKPQGVTSHDVVAYFRRQSGIKRVGHTGTLDPLASGLLIILVGRQFTKRQAEFLKQDKEYLVTAQLGVSTDSYDSDGVITEQLPFSALEGITRQEIEAKLAHFRGKIEQTVPAFSAVKIKGQKLYEQARKGIVIKDLPSRQVEIKELDLIDFEIDEEREKVTFSLRVFCSSGTYIRSLVHDLGQRLKVGAMVSALRRSKIGTLKVEEAIKLSRKNIKKRPDNQLF